MSLKICNSTSISKLSDSNLERMSYIFELFDQYPLFLAAVREDYNLAGSKSTWSLNKVIFIIDFCFLIFFLDKLFIVLVFK